MIIWSSSSIYTRVIQKSSGCSCRELGLNLTLNQKWSPVSKPNHSSSFSFFSSPSLLLLNQTRYFFFNSHLHTQSHFNFSFSSAKKNFWVVEKTREHRRKDKAWPLLIFMGASFFGLWFTCFSFFKVKFCWSQLCFLS